MHQRLAGVGVGEELVEEATHFGGEPGGIEVGRGRRHIDLLPLVVRSSLLVPQDEDRESIFFRVGHPPVVEHAEQVGASRVVLAQFEVDHGQRRPFADVPAAQQERPYGALDVVLAERRRKQPNRARVTRVILRRGHGSSFRFDAAPRCRNTIILLSRRSAAARPAKVAAKDWRMAPAVRSPWASRPHHGPACRQGAPSQPVDYCIASIIAENPS